MKDAKVIIGSRIMQRRKEMKIKQSELAEAIGVSENQISNIENGKSYPRLNSFIQICETLNCSADYLISGSIHKSVSSNIIDMINCCSLEEQELIWCLIDCYIHKKDSI